MKLRKVLALLMAVAMIATMAMVVSAEDAVEEDDLDLLLEEFFEELDELLELLEELDEIIAELDALTSDVGGFGEDAKLNTGIEGVMVLGGVAVLAAGGIIVTRKRK